MRFPHFGPVRTDRRKDALTPGHGRFAFVPRSHGAIPVATVDSLADPAHSGQPP